MTMVSPDDGRPSISRTTRYKKITKPLLERKRRARINRCLDELKDLMVGAFEVEGDNISKLEKADILELTVRHLTKLHSPKDPIADAKRFQAGFGQCAAEACQFILSMPEIDKQIGQNLVKHLSSQISDMPLSVQVPSRPTFSPPISPSARSSWSGSSSVRSVDHPPVLHSNASPPANQAIYNHNSPYVPLMCDTVMNSTPSVHDLSKPMTGLLMTVDNNNVHDEYRAQNLVSDEVKKRHEVEVKHVIMKKIRDQILERQKEHEHKVHHVPPPCVDQRYSNQDYGNYRHYYGNEEATSMDLRMKSKAEYKHYSPPCHDGLNQYDQLASQNAINYSMNGYALHDASRNDNNRVELENEKIRREEEEAYLIRKRQADYRNIHPKKVFIRPISDREVSSQRQEVKKHEYNIKPTSSVLRHHRVPSSHRQFEEYQCGTSSQKYVQSMASMNMRPDNLDNEQEENMWRPW